MATDDDDGPKIFDRLAVPIVFALMFIAPNYMGDVSLESLDTYILSAAVGSTREEVEAGVRRYEYCSYRKPARTVTATSADYVFRGTTSDVGFFASVTVHCPFGEDGLLVAKCSREQWTLIPADVEAYERWSNSYVNQADEWSNAGEPGCPVLD